MREKGFAVLTLIVFIFSIEAKSATPKSQFFPINAELSQNTVSAMIQDHNGFLWIGTRNGLNKYDGINMTTYYYDQANSSSLSSDFIKVLFEDSKNQLWIGTVGGGVCRYIEANDTFESYSSSEAIVQIPGISIYAIYEDEAGVIWFGTEKNGLVKFDPETNSVLTYTNELGNPSSISNNHVRGLTGLNTDHLIVGTWGGGLNILDVNTGEFKYFLNDVNNRQSIASDFTEELYKGESGNIWIATHQGLDQMVLQEGGEIIFKHQKLNSNMGKIKHELILSVLEDSNGKLWVGTENGGLNVIDLETNESIQYIYDATKEYSLQNNSIWSLYEDLDGIVWVGTFNKGVFKVDDESQKFVHHKHNPFANSISNNTVSAFAEEKGGNVWIGTDGGGLNYWDVEENTFTTYSINSKPYSLSSNAILSLYIDSKGNLWIGTWGGGVNLKRKGSNKFDSFNIDHELNKRPGRENVFSFLEDDKGRIWITSFWNGLFAYDPKDDSFLGFVHDENNPHSLSTNLVRSLYKDVSGQIWIGTEGRGLNQMFESAGQFSFKRFSNQNNDKSSLSSHTVVTIREDLNKQLWIGTFSGLNLLDKEKGTFQKYGKKEGLPNEVIYGIEVDSHNNLWISSNQGLSKMSIKNGEVRNFTRDDGLQAMEFFKNSSIKLSNGELLFGGIDGFNSFNPSAIVQNLAEPQVHFSDFKISNQSVEINEKSPLKKSIRQTRKINITHDQNDFSFEFAVLSFQQTAENQYAYQLVNYDDEWQYAGNRREAYYTNVPPGYYVFKVKGTNNDGYWSSNEATVEIVISPAWYNTFWAYSFYIIVITAFLVWGIQIIVNRERLQTEFQLEHVQLSKMQELDEMKSRFFANISHEFRSPLTLILGPLKGMLANESFSGVRSQLSMMIRNAESLLNLINQLLELSKLESGKMRLDAARHDFGIFLKPVVHGFSSFAARKNINFRIDIPKNEIFLYFDKEKIEKVVVNLLSNAFKYTPEFGRVIFRIEESMDEVFIIVEDDGIGIPEDEVDYIFNRYYRVRDTKKSKSKGTGIGLSLTKELIELHAGEIGLESVEDQGTTFKVSLKKGKDHLKPEDLTDQAQDYKLENQGLYEVDEKLSDLTKVEEIEAVEEDEKSALILVVEDNNDIRAYIKQILEVDYRVIEANNGIEGSECALERIPDLIISDIMMPGIDGFEVCKIVKADIKTSHIPVILLTAKASNDSALEGFEVGADYYITKPFNPRLLALRVRNVLNIRDQIRDNILNKRTLNIEPTNVKIASRDEDFIRKAVSIIEDNMSNSEFYVDDLGRELGLSRMQLYRKLKGLIGQSANEFVRSIRLKRAAQLIRQNQMTISEITYQVGFNDLQYFRDCFKKQFGMNPSEYANDSEK